MRVPAKKSIFNSAGATAHPDSPLQGTQSRKALKAQQPMMLRIGSEDVAVGRMVESAERCAAASLEQHGYALLRQVLPPALVKAAGERIAAELGGHGWLRPGSPIGELVAAEGNSGGMLPLDAAHAVA